MSGRRRITGSTFARTSCAAMSGSFERSKVMVTRDWPSVELERSSSMPGNGVDRGLDAIGDFGLDVLGRRTGVRRADRHGRQLDARIAIHAEQGEGNGADHRDRRHEHRGEHRAANAELQRVSACRNAGLAGVTTAACSRDTIAPSYRSARPLVATCSPSATPWTRRTGSARAAGRRLHDAQVGAILIVNHEHAERVGVHVLGRRRREARRTPARSVPGRSSPRQTCRA